MQPNKVLYFNVWGHRQASELNRLMSQLAWTTDICCLTEVTHLPLGSAKKPLIYTSHDPAEAPSQLDGLAQLERAIGNDFMFRYASPSYDDRTCVVTEQTYQKTGFGSLLIYRKSLKVIGVGEYRIELNSNTSSDRLLQWIVYEKGFVRYLVAHLHGVWIKGNTKGDDWLRELQSLLVRRYLADIRRLYDVRRTSLGGDLNLAMDTVALRMLEEPAYDGVPLVNLVLENGVLSTRTPHYRDYGKPGACLHADYVLVSPCVKVRSLSVDTTCRASNHAPMLVTFT